MNDFAGSEGASVLPGRNMTPVGALIYQMVRLMQASLVDPENDDPDMDIEVLFLYGQCRRVIERSKRAGPAFKKRWERLEQRLLEGPSDDELAVMSMDSWRLQLRLEQFEALFSACVDTGHLEYNPLPEDVVPDAEEG